MTFILGMEKVFVIGFVIGKNIYKVEGIRQGTNCTQKKKSISQEGLATMIGVSRGTIATIENKKETMTWNMFLSLILVFTKNNETDKPLNVLEIYTDELNEFIKYNI